MKPWLLVLPVSLLLGSCAHASKQGERTAAASPTPAFASATTPVPAPVASAAPTPQPARTTALTPTPALTSGEEVEVVSTPLPTASPTPMPSPTLAPPTEPGTHTPVVSLAPTAPPSVHVIAQEGRYAGRLAAPQDPPKIFSVEVSDAAPVSGETVTSKVVTTTNVAAVTASVKGISVGFQRDDFGIFTLAYTVPSLPFFLKHAYTVEITAITADGRKANARIPIRVR